jgi:curved DNA-binding protein CbpA
MGETFYGALGVREGADEAAIESAYRELVKEAHPDVSDAPDAGERFTRLTTARDVLVDPDERARYDRLGHATYVRRHVDTPVWTVPADGAGESGDDTGRTDRTDGPARTERADPAERTAWLGDDWERPETGGAAGTGSMAGASGGWNGAAAASRHRGTDAAAGATDGANALRVLRRLAPWLVIHTVFLSSALATGWFTYSQLDQYVELTAPALFAGVGLFGLVLFVSVLHLATLVYR